MRYKLQCIGLPLKRSSTLIGDNKSVILNTTSPASKIKKKPLSCQLMHVREAIAVRYVKFAHIISSLNLANGLTDKAIISYQTPSEILLLSFPTSAST